MAPNVGLIEETGRGWLNVGVEGDLGFRGHFWDAGFAVG
jgi:hypothetical protein